MKAWPGEESEVYDLFNSSWELQVCRDIANGAKHLDLSRPPSVDAHYQIALSRSYWTETGAPRNEFVLQAGGKRAELSEFCRACVEQLRQWLVTRGLTSEDGHKFAGFGPRLASSEGSG